MKKLYHLLFLLFSAGIFNQPIETFPYFSRAVSYLLPRQANRFLLWQYAAKNLLSFVRKNPIQFVHKNHIQSSSVVFCLLGLLYLSGLFYNSSEHSDNRSLDRLIHEAYLLKETNQTDALSQTEAVLTDKIMKELVRTDKDEHLSLIAAMLPRESLLNKQGFYTFYHGMSRNVYLQLYFYTELYRSLFGIDVPNVLIMRPYTQEESYYPYYIHTEGHIGADGKITEKVSHVYAPNSYRLSEEQWHNKREKYLECGVENDVLNTEDRNCLLAVNPSPLAGRNSSEENCLSFGVKKFNSIDKNFGVSYILENFFNDLGLVHYYHKHVDCLLKELPFSTCDSNVMLQIALDAEATKNCSYLSHPYGKLKNIGMSSDTILTMLRTNTRNAQKSLLLEGNTFAGDFQFRIAFTGDAEYGLLNPQNVAKHMQVYRYDGLGKNAQLEKIEKKLSYEAQAIAHEIKKSPEQLAKVKNLMETWYLK